MQAMERVKLWTWLTLAALCAAPAPARPDVIFKVPEVLVRHAAAPRPVGTGPAANGTRANVSELWTEDGHELLHERFEYFVEHEVSTADAKRAAQVLRLAAVPDAPPGCGKCTRRELEYCETKVMADHCCCERRFLPEPFPWLPHTCYIGPERCTPIAHNCARYTRLRDCCCYKKLAERWKAILSRGSHLSISGLALLLFSLILFTLYL